MTIPEHKITTLKNGVKLLTETMEDVRSVAMGIFVGAGSGLEKPPIAGISHFIEHMAFKGTKKRSAFDIASEFDAIGGKMNASTGKELTSYYAVTLDKHINVAVDVLSDIFLNSIYDEKEIELEKGVIVEEIKMYEDTPDELIHDLFTEVIYHGHPLGRPTIGSEKSVRAIGRQDMIGYIKDLYTPDNIIIALAGNIKHEEAAKLIEPAFSVMRGKFPVAQKASPTIKKSVKLKHKKTEQVHMCLGSMGPSQHDEDRYAFSILDTVIGGSMSSRLFQEVREKRGLAYSIYSYSGALKDCGIYVVYAGTSKENFRKVIDLTISEFDNIKKNGITKEEMNRSKEHLKGSLVLGLESTSSRMAYLARSQYYYDRIITIDEMFTKVDKVTLDDIMNAANKYMKNEYLTLTAIGDISEEEMPKV
ncbi:MAG: pitrilysin family protein [bacterium]